MAKFNPLAQFVTQLVHNPDARKAYLKNRESAIADSRLTDDDKAVLTADRLSMLIDWLDPEDDRPTPERQGGGGSGSGGSGGGSGGG